MAALNPTDIVKDQEYSNWLKVTLALYYMKSGLHTFIQDEVNHLHGSLVHKIYGGNIVTPCTTCDASLVKRKNQKWTFQIKCKLFCDKWFDELLALHTNPTSEKIYWNNSDVPSWSCKPWECAKVFMPRGQQPSNVGPVQCDAQALLTLLGNCKHFQPKLSLPGQGLIRTISVIRNKVIHDGQMKISDADRRIYIQQIIQLLEDHIILKSEKDCKDAVSNIRKIDNESLDVVFSLEFEMAALRSAVNECRLQLGVQEKTLDTVNSLKEEYKELMKRFVDFENRLGTIDRDVQSLKQKTDTALQQQEKKHLEMHTTVTTHGVRLDAVENNSQAFGTELHEFEIKTDTALKQQEKINHETHTNVTHLFANITSQGLRFDTVEANMQSYGKELKEFTTNTDTALQQQEMKQQEMHTAVTLLGARIDNTEKNMHSFGVKLQELKTSESRNERKESAELKQLKQLTENLLDTARKINFIPTKQAEKIRCHLQQYNWVTIQGNPGEGKTTTALHFLDEFGQRDRRVVVRSPIDWRIVDTKYVEFVFIEDIFGRFDLESNCLEEWCGYLQDIEKHNELGKLKVVITTRVDILSKSLSKLGMLKFFRRNHVQTLSSKNLQDSEKKNMLESMLHNRTRNMDNELQLHCLQNFKGSLGFPQCCSLFSGEEDLFKKGPEFFRKPEEFFHENIKIYTGKKCLLFAFLFCNDGCFQNEIISPGPMPQENVKQLEDLAHWLDLDDDEPVTTLLRNECRNYSGVYIETSGPCIRFTHDTIYEAVGTVLGEQAPEIVIKYCSTDFLFQRIHCKNESIPRTDQVCISESLYGMLADRIISKDLEKLNSERLAYFPHLNHREFVNIFSEKLHHVNSTEKFLRIGSSQYMDENKQIHGICSTVLQHCLRRNPETDFDTVNNVFKKFLEFLSCAKSCGCWKCIETQNLLEHSLYYGHFDITHKLLELKAVLTPVSLCNAARHDKEKIIKFILEDLKRRGKFVPQEELVRMSLCRAFISGSWSVVDLLLKEGILLDFNDLERTVREGNYTAVASVIKHLKSNGHWPNADESSRIEVKLPTSYEIQIALKVAYRVEKYDVADLLVQEGVHVEMHLLPFVVKDCFSEAVENMVKHLKDGNKWDPQSEQALKAMEVCTSLESYIEGREEKVKLLCNEGMTFTSIHSLPYLICYEPSSAIKLVQFLKDNETWVSESLECKVKALENAFVYERNELSDLLVNDGVKLEMESLPNLVKRASDESNVISTVIQHLKVHNNWESRSQPASVALLEAFIWKKNCIWKLLNREGCTISRTQLPSDLVKLVAQTSEGSVGEHFEEFVDLIEEEVEMSGTDNVTPEYSPLYNAREAQNAIEALQEAFMFENNGWCNLMIKKGTTLSTKNLFEVVWRASDNAIINIVKHLKEKKTWKSNSEAASGSLMVLFIRQKTKLCDLLIQEGVTLDMKNLAGIIQFASDSVINTVIEYLKVNKKWDPKSDAALHALNQACKKGKTGLCELLFQEGFGNSMTDLPDVVKNASYDFIIKVIEHLKVTKEWESKSSAALDALKMVCREGRTDLCELLLREGVGNSMTNLADVVEVNNTSHACIMKVIEHMKVTKEWDPKSSAALHALKLVCREARIDLCEVLLQEGVGNSMTDFPDVVKVKNTSCVCIMKVIKHMKVTKEWDPKSSAALDALNWACRSRTGVCELLHQEGVRISMTNLPYVVNNTSYDFIMKVIEQLKVTKEWDPKSSAALDAFNWACREGRTCVCELLHQEGVRISMTDLPDVVKKMSYDFIMEVTEQLKVTKEWDPKSIAALEALKWAHREGRTHLCELLIRQGVRNIVIDLSDVVKNK